MSHVLCRQYDKNCGLLHSWSWYMAFCRYRLRVSNAGDVFSTVLLQKSSPIAIQSQASQSAVQRWVWVKNQNATILSVDLHALEKLTFPPQGPVWCQRDYLGAAQLGSSEDPAADVPTFVLSRVLWVIQIHLCFGVWSSHIQLKTSKFFLGALGHVWVDWMGKHCGLYPLLPTLVASIIFNQDTQLLLRVRESTFSTPKKVGELQVNQIEPPVKPWLNQHSSGVSPPSNKTHGLFHCDLDLELVR